MNGPRDVDDDAFETGVSALTQIGLTEYQARVYVGLSRIHSGTAREVADASGVPRARVYDTLNALHDRGIVDIQQSTPREYLAVPVESAIDVLETRYRENEDRVRAALADVNTDEETPDVTQEGVWVVTERDRVSSLERRFIDEATERIIFGIASEEVFDEETAASLEAANEGVEIVVETVDEELVARFEVAPHVDVMTPEQAWEHTPELEGKIGRILVVDDQHILVSTVLGHEQVRGAPDESAVWTSGGGAGDGLVLALRNLMLERVENRVRGEGEDDAGDGDGGGSRTAADRGES
ncbi:TrmB family transcriptional regulator [Salinigranum halophilum]|jgi:sugar-specific transcriptional regulator TrmB|uniref:TrmB family transcriptional regulator n=1 Tax=Salinigranum halophilum TaxID=2565931 RepID=UPI00115CE501|nr:helix-turn-helix domain-containing protein [Salinigranum halophilum]